MQRSRSIVLGAGLMSLLVLAGSPRSALGQNALGDGRALDRNLQHGSGGANTKVRDLDAQIRLNNAIVTGNAAYGRSFRGNAGYLATDDFRAGLGSNDLFNEYRISAGSAALGGVATTGGSGMFNSATPADPGSVRFTQRGIRGTDALRYQMALTTGNASPAEASDAPITVRRSGTGASGRTVGNAIRSTAEFRAQRSIQPTVLGTELGPDGTPYALLASPLMGVKVRALESDLNPSNPGEPGRWRPTGLESQARLARERVAGTGEGPDPRLTTPPTAVSTKLDTEAGSVGGVIDRFRDESQARAGGASAVDTRLQPTDAGRPDAQKPDTALPGAGKPGDSGPLPAGSKPGDKPTKPGDRSVPSDPSNPPLPGGSPAPGETDEARPAWLTSLDDMRRTLRGEPPRRDPKGEGESPDAGNPSVDRPESKSTDGTSERRKLNSLTSQEKRNELDARVKAIIDAQGFDQQDAFTIEQVEAAKKARVKMNTMIAGKHASVYYIDRMVDGETALREERYFDAEDAFSRALGASPLDAMAQAGRVHAQIGAGLYMSAAANLRDVVATHPEMVGVKYDLTVMPAAERLKTIREQLATAASKTESALSGDAGLLLAYLAYQAGDLEGVDKGLRTFGAKIQPDNAADLALLELAARVWKAPVPADLPVLERSPENLPRPAGDAGNTNK